MALTRIQKEKLVDVYKSDISNAKNVVILKQFWVTVNEINRLRKEISTTGWKLCVIKKRVFLNTSSEAWLEKVELSNLEWSVVALYSMEDEFAPLKAVAKILKEWKKEKKEFQLDYIWGWYDKEWKDASYVSEIANLPTKDELLAKFAFLVNYPVRSFAVAINEIAKKKWE